MTTILQIRPPLESMSMNENSSRRRSTRVEEKRKSAGEWIRDAGALRLRLLHRSSTMDPMTDGRKASYTENDGDFNFTRAPKRRKGEAVPAIAEEPVQPAAKKTKTSTKQPIEQPDEPRTARKKSTRRAMDFATPKQESKDPIKAVKRATRRSTRLSGDGNVNLSGSNVNGSKGDEEDIIDMVGGNSMNATGSILDSTSESTTIALPFSDTPVIDRNKKLRRKGSVGRRSSLGLRGRRASSLIDNGRSAIPHREVEATEFYKHIAADGISEPRRMKQLLTWCGERALGEKPAHDQPDSYARQIARAIEEELLKDFSNRSEMSDWFSREETVRPTIVKKPNPKNIENTEKIKELEENIKKLQLERTEWKNLTKVPSSLPPLLDTTKQPPALSFLDASLLDPEQAAILSQLQSSNSASDLLSQTSSRLKSIQDSLEFKVDQFADGVHKLEQYREISEKVANKVLALGAVRLEERSTREKEAAGSRDMPVKEILRTLSGILPESGLP